MEDRALQEISLNVTPVDIPCVSVGNLEDVGKYTAAKIQAQIQKTKPTRIKISKISSKSKFDILFCRLFSAWLCALCSRFQDLPTCFLYSLLCAE